MAGVLTSRMAAAIDALFVLADAALTDTAVVDGPFDDSDSGVATAQKRLFIGASEVTGDDETIAVDGDQSFRTIGARQRTEDFTVHCVAEGWNGDNLMKPARDGAVAVLAAVEVLLRPVPGNTQAYTVSGSVMWAGIGHEEMTQDKNENGAYCRIAFEVQCRANLINQT